MKKQFNLFDSIQLNSSPDYECGQPNAVYNFLGMHNYHFVRGIIKMNHSVDIRWYEEESDEEHSIITFLHFYCNKSKTSMTVSSNLLHISYKCHELLGKYAGLNF